MKPGAWIVAGVLAVVAGGHLAAAAVRLTASNKPRRSIPREIDERVLLHAIAERESGNDPRAIGRIWGERSKYQFTADTWRLHSRAPFIRATEDPKLADEIAVRHLAYIRSVLRLRHLGESVERIAAAWHFGPEFAIACAEGPYAEYVRNLYVDEVTR